MDQVVKKGSLLLLLDTVSSLKMEARKAYKQGYLLVLEKLVKLLTCAIVKTAQYQEENPPVAKLNNKVSIGKYNGNAFTATL